MSVKAIILTTKGIIRDQAVEADPADVHPPMVLAAMQMVAARTTVLSGWLMGVNRMFLLYWLVCAWVTMTSTLPAIFDMLAVRLLLRREKRRLKEETSSGRKDGGED